MKNNIGLMRLTLACSLLLIVGPGITKLQAQSVDYSAIFENLDPANIPTGILLDKSFPESNILEYDGTNNSIVMLNDEWEIIYKELLLSHVTSYSIPTLTQLNETLNQYYVSNVVPISIINMSYNYLKDNALDDSLLILTNDQLFEVPNPPESPYLETRYFSAMSFPNQSNSEVITYTFDPNLYISNTNETLLSIDINFGNGIYYYGLSLNSEVTVNRSSLGDNIHLTLHFQGGINLECNFETQKILLEKIDDNSSDDEIVITDASYNGNMYGAHCGVWFGCETTSLNTLRKPIIVLEGWDPTDNRTASEAFGEINVNDFTSNLREEGFDFIVVDYDKGGAEIQGNAMALVKLIDTLRIIMETNNNYNELIIMGVSMGGLVGRYALAYMESINQPHYTKLFLSMDSPQQGAYISYATQHLAFHLYDNLKDTDILSIPQINKIVKEFFSIASQQMLVYYRPDCQPDYPAPSSLRTQLLNELNSFGNNGYPTNVDKMVAFSFGSGDSINQGYSSGDTRINFNSSNNGLSIHFLQRALPDNTNLKIHEFFIEKTVYNKCSGWPILKWFCGRTDSITIPIIYSELEVHNTLPYENAPGSFQKVTFDFVDVLNEELNTSITLSSDQDCFIPTISALHLLNVPLNYNIRANIPHTGNYFEINNPSITPFDAFYVEHTNNIHANVGVSDSMMIKVEELIVIQDLDLNNEIITNDQIQYEANNKIVLENVTVQNGSTLNLRAGQEITFNNNTSIGLGCSMNATVQPTCQ